MKNVSSALQTLFAAGTQFLMADLYTVTLVNGLGTLYYTSADVSLTWNGHLYTCLGPKIQRDQIKVIVGVQVDSLDISFFPELTDLVLGEPFYQQVIQGVLDGAWISLDRAFLTSWTTAGLVGTVNMFQGKVAGCVVGRTSAKLTVKSPLELLNMNLPRNTYQQGCQHNLFDAGCGLSQAAFAVSGACTGTQGTGNLQTNLTQPNGYFTLGYLQFTSGVLNGQWRSINGTNSTGGLALMYPFPEAPSSGDTFTIYPGCDHQQATCSGKFNNIIHFRGFPYVPAPTTAV